MVLPGPSFPKLSDILKFSAIEAGSSLDQTLYGRALLYSKYNIHVARARVLRAQYGKNETRCFILGYIVHKRGR
ncbi:hypothetical protein M378DRAFT_533528 [Amanita muscaria Koide BX008]|uniref:Uncharacterized protein n=1 Tax=Amanita muscaria (strain Koide BX008) TaxID=946122 RepID=A0A0C2WJ79_AMAMK|nr:hypothetical protein M378DRAFT_533528 [Amanita muscaria Koide BX008]